MRSVLRRAFAVAALVGASAVTAQAQMGGLKVEEIRIDLAGINITNGTFLGANIPGSVALGIYLNDKVALEPTLGFNYSKPDGAADGTTSLSLGVMAPFYFAGDRGHSGLFVAPGVMIGKVTDVDAAIDFGVDVGFKGKMSDKVSWRAAAQLRDGDSYGDASIGGVFGLSVWWR
jgi:hypothetical protein